MVYRCRGDFNNVDVSVRGDVIIGDVNVLEDFGLEEGIGRDIGVEIDAVVRVFRICQCRW